LFVCINSEFVSTFYADGCSKRKCFRSSDVKPPLQDNFSPQISHEAYVCHHQDVYTISKHHFHYCVSLFTTLIHCCTVALCNLRKLYPNNITKFGQLMQNCKLVTIHRNMTTRNDITGVRHCFSLQLLQPRTGRAPEPC